MVTHLVPTGRGQARAHVHPARDARATVLLGHGAGRGTDTTDLLALAEGLPGHGVEVVLVDQPWVVAGRRVAAPSRTLDEAWCDVATWLRGSGLVSRGPLVVGGRSTGARVACRTADAVGADSLLLLAFPLCPPAARKDPAKAAAALQTRLSEWALALPRPVVLVQGERDPFGSGPDVVAALAKRGMPRPGLVEVPDADHGLAPRRATSAEQVSSLLVAAALRAVAATASRADGQR